MGQFSWVTQDTNEVIREKYGCDDKEKTTAYMWDNKGNKWKEERYEGYGKFGGKDFYILLSEMNGIKGSDDKKRDLGIDLYFSDKPFISPNLTRNDNWTWVNRRPEDDEGQGWED